MAKEGAGRIVCFSGFPDSQVISPEKHIVYTRADASMAKVVDNGLAIDAVQGPSIAWTYLQGCKVPQEIILRVLAEPQFRRSSHATAGSGMIGLTDEGKAIHLWRVPQE